MPFGKGSDFKALLYEWVAENILAAQTHTVYFGDSHCSWYADMMAQKGKLGGGKDTLLF